MEGVHSKGMHDSPALPKWDNQEESKHHLLMRHKCIWDGAGLVPALEGDRSWIHRRKHSEVADAPRTNGVRQWKRSVSRQCVSSCHVSFFLYCIIPVPSLSLVTWRSTLYIIILVFARSTCHNELSETFQCRHYVACEMTCSSSILNFFEETAPFWIGTGHAMPFDCQWRFCHRLELRSNKLSPKSTLF